MAIPARMERCILDEGHEGRCDFHDAALKRMLPWVRKTDARLRCQRLLDELPDELLDEAEEELRGIGEHHRCVLEAKGRGDAQKVVKGVVAEVTREVRV